ncbi:MAG TPA: hypothetical protein VK745_11570 [Polyangiaceae bacterium]|nr:hypothetical protein [Polyangiaceae bacterium]
MKTLLASLSCVLLLLAACSARAEEAAARLELTKGPGTEQCIDTGALLRSVEFRLQRHAFRPDRPATLYVRIALHRIKADANWSADISMRDAAGAFLGSRSLITSAAHCSALDDSLALVVALLVDAPPAPVRVEPPGPTAATPAVPAASSAEPSPAGDHATPSVSPIRPPQMPTFPEKMGTITLPRDTPARRQPWLFNLSLEGTAAFGVLPDVAPGIELGLGAKPAIVPELRVFAGLYPERAEQHASASSGARFSFANVGLELCPLDRALGAVHWSGCAGQSLGFTRVAAFGFDENTTTGHLSYALLAWTGLTIQFVGSFAGRLGIRAEAPLERGVFTYGSRDGSERGLFEPKPVTAVLDAGLIVGL